MSQAHKHAFELVRIEHDTVVRLLRASSSSSEPGGFRPKDPSTGKPVSNKDVIEAAIATADDAYALLLIAKAEGFMRAYLDSIGILMGQEPTLRSLIDRSRKEYNKRNPSAPIHADLVIEIHDLRTQRNMYPRVRH